MGASRGAKIATEITPLVSVLLSHCLVCLTEGGPHSLSHAQCCVFMDIVAEAGAGAGKGAGELVSSIFQTCSVGSCEKEAK